MNKYETYFGQVITDDELNEIFNSFALAIEQFIQDFGYSGIAVGGDLAQNATPNLTVNVTAPTVVYDQFGNRIAFASPQVLPVNVDENNANTAVVTAGNEKWLSVFLKFTSTPTEPRVDELGETVYFRKVAGFQLRVAQGSEAPIGTAARAPLRGDQILLGDVKLVNGQTTVVTANIDNTRQQTIYNVAGTPNSVKAKGLMGLVQQLLAIINSISTSSLVVPAIAGSPVSIVTGSVNNVFGQVLAALNVVKNDLATLSGAHSSLQTAHNNLQTQVNAISIPDVSGFAVRNSSNTFVGEQIVNNTSASTPLLSTYAEPDADPVSGNHWKIIFNFRLSAGGQYIRCYTGDDPSKGLFAITTNVFWDVANLRWTQSLHTIMSSALIWFTDKIRFATKDAGGNPTTPLTWTDWNHIDIGEVQVGDFYAKGSISSDGDIISLGGQVSAASGLFPSSVSTGTLSATGGTISSTLTVGGDITTNGDIRLSSSKRIRYPSGIEPVRWVNVPLSSGLCNGDAVKFFGNYWQGDFAGSGNIVNFPLRLPDRAVFVALEAFHYTPDVGHPQSFHILSRGFDWSADTIVSAPSTTEITDTLIIDGYGAISRQSRSCTTTPVLNDVSEYFISAVMVPLAECRLYGLRYAFKDPGASNA